MRRLTEIVSFLRSLKYLWIRFELDLMLLIRDLFLFYFYCITPLNWILESLMNLQSDIIGRLEKLLETHPRETFTFIQSILFDHGC